MKKGWEKSCLREVATKIGSGATPVGGEAAYKASGISLIRSLNVHDAGFRMKDLAFIDDQQAAQLDNVVVESGDVLLNITGASVARCCIVPDELLPARVNQHVSIIRPAKGRLLSRLLQYMLISHDYKSRLLGVGEAGGSTRQALTKAQLQDFQIEYPASLAEQQRIVGVLDEAFAGLATAQANAEKNLQNARALFESHLQSVFTKGSQSAAEGLGKGWTEKTLGSCCEQIFAGGDVPKDRLSQERTAKFSVPIYSNGEKNDGLYGFTDAARVTKPSITVSARGTLGFTAIRTEPFLPVVRLIVLVPDEKQIMLSFLYYAVVGMDFGNTGTSIPQLTVPNFKESKLNVPSISEQETIVAKLAALATETQRLESLYQQKLDALAALKKSLLHQAFSGAL